MSFKEKYEAFLDRCDASEDMQAWNEEKYGPIDICVENDLFSLALYIIGTDGSVTAREVEAFNSCLGYEMSAEELQTIYQANAELIGGNVVSNIRGDLMTIESYDTHIGEAFEGIVLELCKLMSEADGILTEEERALAEELKKAL